MKPEVKKVGIILLAVFLIWIFVSIVLAFGSCIPAYDVEKIRYDPNIPGTIPASNVHVTDRDLVSRPYLEEAFEDGKSIILPRGDITDFIPGNVFGPGYATNRMTLSDREEFVDTIVLHQNTIWEHNGTYIRFRVRTC